MLPAPGTCGTGGQVLRALPVEQHVLAGGQTEVVQREAAEPVEEDPERAERDDNGTGHDDGSD